MNVRDGLDDDVSALETLSDLPRGALERLLHERRVRVATTGNGNERDPGDVIGFVAYDLHDDAVHVSRLAGDEDTFDALLEEPRAFATSEGVALEIVVPESDEETRSAVETLGFEARENGPRFEGEETRKYRWEGE